MFGAMVRESGWTPKLDKAGKPVYLAIADAIASDVRDGVLAVGTRLPPLRALAERLGLDFTTVSRAYAEAGRRGLLVGRVGQGTFVCAPPGEAVAVRDAARTAGVVPSVIDMTMNAPPLPADPGLLGRMRRDMADLAADLAERRLFGYGDHAGGEDDRAAGVTWLRHRLPDLTAERVLICPGAQGAMLALVSTLARPGEVMACEALTYPGMKALAGHLGLNLVGVAMDDGGLLPDAFEAVCRAHAPKALYCNPTLHNPTATTLDAERRAAIVAIARRFGVAIVEDDAYGLLPEAGPPPLAVFGPDITYHIAGLAKCLAPAMRIAYLAVPDRRAAMRMAAALRATMLMASPISAALASRWIGSGLAGEVLAGIRAEARARQSLATELLPAESFFGDSDAFHLWLRLPGGWSRSDFTAHLRSRRLAVVAADAFAVGAVRICLGTLADGDETRRVLGLLADLMDQPASVALSVV